MLAGQNRVSICQRELGKVVEVPALLPVQAMRPSERSAPFTFCARTGDIGLKLQEHRLGKQDVRFDRCIVECVRRPPCARKPIERVAHVALHARQDHEQASDFCARELLAGLNWQLKQLCQTSTTFDSAVRTGPPPAQRRGEADAELRIAQLDGVVHRIPHVGSLPREPPVGLQLLGTVELRCGGFRDGEQVQCVASACVGQVATVADAAQRELANRLQQTIALLAVRLELGLDQRLVDQAAQPYPCGRTIVDRLGGLECEAVGEDRQVLEQSLFGCLQKLITPVDRRLDTLLAHRQPASADRWRAQQIVESQRNVRGSKSSHLRGRQLDCERNPIHPPTDRGHGQRAGGAHFEVAPRRARAVQEQITGGAVNHGFRIVADRQREGGTGQVISP